MGPRAKQWLLKYQAEHALYIEAAKLARALISESLEARALAVHSTDARAKSIESVTSKIRAKGYGLPSKQMTDLIGVRVITSYSSEVSRVVDALRSQYEVDEVNSVDKTSQLAENEFGYRSVHLVLQITGQGIVSDAARKLETIKAEVQVRSIIEHAWAEAEHELRYKSGVATPSSFSRRFNALAGALEIIDREFDSLSLELPQLVRHYQTLYTSDRPRDEALDSARLMGLLIAKRPGILISEPNGLPADFRTAAACVRALAAVNILHDNELVNMVNSPTFRTLARGYADLRGILPERLSLAAVTAIAISVIAPDVLSDHPVVNDPVVRSVLASFT